MTANPATITPPVPVPPAPVVSPPSTPGIVIDGRLHIPPGLGDLESFRSWARSEECPEHVRLAYLAGTLWVDRTMEQLYTHNQIKGEVGAVLWRLVKASGQGRYLPDGMLLSN